jgi:hypothetical protein
MESFWKGAIAQPKMVKHRLGTGDIRNHIEIADMTYHPRKKTVEIEFMLEGTDESYTLELDWDPEDGEFDPEEAMDEIVAVITPEA